MGLDWYPGDRAKAGHEVEFAEVVAKLRKRPFFGRKKIEARYAALAISPFETLNTPRTGRDEAANTWAREQHARSGSKIPIEKWLRKIDGQYVPELLADSAGLPTYSNSALSGEVFSFRAEFLNDCEQILDEELLAAAYERKPPAALIEYGQQLIAEANRLAKVHGVDLKALDTDDDEGIEFQLDIILQAGQWCVFWGERGHPLEVDW